MWPDIASIPDISDHQREQLAVATSGPIGLLTGGPGTGKTHTLSKLLAALGHTDFVVCAPTGKAASRLDEFNPSLCAKTIHATLQVGRNGHDGFGWGFQRNESWPLDAELVVVDEWSMVDVRLCRDLMRAVRRGSRVLLVGDPFQLPPVGPGKPLEDLIAAGLPHGHLTEIFRFAGRIAEVCRLIREGKRWEPSPKVDLDAEFPENLRHYECGTATAQIQTMLAAIDALAEKRGFDPIADVQVICPLNEKSPLSRDRLNSVLQEKLNPDGERSAKHPFRVGDKAICLRNGVRDTFDVDGRQPEENRDSAHIANGDTGIVVAVAEKAAFVRFTAGVVQFRGEDMRNVALAYAITGHKSQGSQWPVTIAMADDYPGANFVCDRNWWYTILSRAKNLSVVVGKRATIDRHCRTVGSSRRRTLLRERIEELRTESPACLTTSPN